MNKYETGNKYVDNIIKENRVLSQKGPPPHAIKKVINGITYNTKTSDCVATWHTPDEFKKNEWFQGTEALYQTRTANFFLVVYSHAGGHPGGFVLGHRIICGHALVPLTNEEAQQWAEHRGQTEKLLILTREDVSTTSAITLRVSPNLVAKLNDAAELAGVSRNDLIVRSLENIPLRKGRMSLTSHRDSWDYFRIDPDAVELSRQQAAGLVLRGAGAVAEAVAIAETDDGEWRHMLPEHRRAIIFAITGDEKARAGLISPQARAVYEQARGQGRANSVEPATNPYRDSDPELEAAVDVGWDDGRAEAEREVPRQL